MQKILFFLFLMPCLIVSQNCSDNMSVCQVDTLNNNILYSVELSANSGVLQGYINNFYQTDFQIRVPTDTSLVYALGSGEPQLFENVQINTLVISDIEGLPAGLSFECSNDSCYFNGGDSGCFSIKGTPTIVGDYQLTLVFDVSVTYLIPGLNPINLDVTDDQLGSELFILNIADCIDVYGCTDSDACNYDVNANLDDGSCEYISFEIYTQDAFCEDHFGFVSLSDISGGNPPYEIDWGGLNTGFVPVGNHMVNVTDASGCSMEQSYSIGFVENDCGECDTVFVEIPVLDTIFEVEYVEVFVMDTIWEYMEFVVTEYIDCDTGFPCDTGIQEVINQSKTDSKIYNLLGEEIKIKVGLYIEGGEVKYKIK